MVSSSPWAKLIRPMIEKSIARPSASSAYVEPSESPLMHCWTNSCSVMSFGHAEVRGLHAAIAAELVRRPLRVDPADPHQVGAVGDAKRLVDVLLDEQDRHALLVAQPDDQVEDEPDELRREAERRLVEEQQPRPGHERPRDRELLLLAARERGGRQAQPLAERREELEQALAVSVVGPAAARGGGAEPQVLRHREPREDPPALGCKPHASTDDPLRRQVA